MKRLVNVAVCVLAVFSAHAARSITVTDTAGYASPALGNGHIGVVMSAGGLSPERVFSHSCVRSGAPGEVSSLIPTVVPVNLSINGHTTLAGAKRWSQTLDMDSASVTTCGVLPDVSVRCSFRTLRQLPGMLMADVEVTAMRDTRVTVVNAPSIPSAYSDAAVYPRTVWCEDGGRKIVVASGRFNDRRDAVSASAAFVVSEPWTFVSPDTVSISLTKGDTARLSVLAAVCTTADFRDPWNEAERMLIYACRLAPGSLRQAHADEWARLWQSNVVIDGDARLQQIADVALYNIYSSIREGSRKSIAPMGLTSDKYFGHIFWDADMWIFPALAVLHPELARGVVDFRFDGLAQARKRAAAYGYAGAMFPWEADDAGEESTPTFALTGPLEHHITAVVALAAWNYYKLTGDEAWLRNEGWPVIKACADFWLSRVTRNADGSFSINNVVGADEYAIGVDDNAFTNGAVRRALEAAVSAAQVIGEMPAPGYAEVAGRLRVPRNSDGIVLEYEGYSNAKIKQADVALLAYPLALLTENVDENIRFYDSKLDREHGPAMSHSVMSVNYARMGQGNRAYDVMMQGVSPYLTGAFQSIAETPANGETYFMTGAGGLLQALMFGFAGLDITSSGIVQVHSSLPPHISGVRVNLADGRTFVRTATD